MALSNEQKREILTARIQQFESELYQHELNKATAEALSSPTTDIETAISQLNTAIAVHEQQLADLTFDVVSDANTE